MDDGILDAVVQEALDALSAGMSDEHDRLDDRTWQALRGFIRKAVLDGYSEGLTDGVDSMKD